MMKKSLLTGVVTLALAFSIGGCATKSDIKEAHAREMAISAKADQAAQDAQAAKSAADEALMRANEAVARAEAAEKRAEEREERARQAEEAFQGSMRK